MKPEDRPNPQEVIEGINKIIKGMEVTIEDLDPVQTSKNLKEDYILIEKSKVLHYDKLNDENHTQIEIPSNNTFLTQFKIT